MEKNPPKDTLRYILPKGGKTSDYKPVLNYLTVSPMISSAISLKHKNIRTALLGEIRGLCPPAPLTHSGPEVLPRNYKVRVKVGN